MNTFIRRGTQLQKFLKSNKFLVKNCSTATEAENKNKVKTSYDDFIHNRQAEAVRSIVVQVSSEKSFRELYNYCSDYGTVVSAHHYRVDNEDNLHYILLEFSNVEEAAAAIDSSSFNEELTGASVRSPFLWFRAARGKKKTAEKELPEETAALQVVEGTRCAANDDLHSLLHTAESIENQIQILHRVTKLNDLGVRLRFLAALQVQSALSGMFPDANAQPFGSSVNGFGRMGCDLDLILRFDREQVGGALAKRRSNSRLVFHTKENLSNGRSQTQRQMESIGDMLQLFLPGVSHVRRILQARVPIIKYHHEHLNVEVDLSMSNLTGFYMSELLYMFGELDDRVRPLTFSIRRWAQCCGLTNPSPGRWISNFSLTCLVIFFLQQMKRPVLPTINDLMKSASKQDIRFTEEGINCTFGRNFERIGFTARNTRQINELLLQFFEFYAQFDFHNRAISLNEGRAIAKPDHSALYIVNPLEQILNVSKNVSLEECERLRIEVRNAAWVLESEMENAALNHDKSPITWGLLNLFKTPEKSIIRPNMFFKTRMMDVSELFDNDSENRAEPTPTTTPNSIENVSTREELKKIKTQARNDIKQMRLNAMSGNAKSSKGRRS